MRIIIYAFSGTGNTLKVAELYRENLSREGGNSVTVFSIEHILPHTPVPDPNDFDLCGFAYPVHGFNAPEIFVDFCRSLPAVTGDEKPAFVFKTSGEGLTLNNHSSQKFMRVLERKGFAFLSERHYVMPYNMIFRHSPEMVKSEWIFARGLALLHSREIMEKKKENVRTSPLKAWFVPLFRIEWLYARAQGPFMRVDMDKCLKCMRCVKRCPCDNITFDSDRNKFKFGTKCALCVRCSFSCPSCAISIGLLNGWRINGDYRIEETADDPSIKFPYFTEELRGLRRWAYYRYYKNLAERLSRNGISISGETLS